MPHGDDAAPNSGVLIDTLKDLLRWLEYGDLDKGIGKQEGVAWTNALAAAIKTLEKRETR